MRIIFGALMTTLYLFVIYAAYNMFTSSAFDDCIYYAYVVGASGVIGCISSVILTFKTIFKEEETE